jgi:hypothetical protein
MVKWLVIGYVIVFKNFQLIIIIVIVVLCNYSKS